MFIRTPRSLHEHRARQNDAVLSEKQERPSHSLALFHCPKTLHKWRRRFDSNNF